MPGNKAVAAAFVCIGVAGAVVVGGDPAGAQAGFLRAHAVGDVSVATCQWTFAGYSAVTNTVTANLQGSISPKFAQGYVTNTSEYVQCEISSPYYGHLDTESATGTGGTINFRRKVVLPYDTSYTLCAYGVTGTSNSGTHTTPVACVQG